MFQTVYKGCSGALFFAKLEKKPHTSSSKRKIQRLAVFAIFFLLLAQKKEIKKRAGEIPACRQAGMRRLNSVEQVSLPISPFTTELPRALSVDHNARRRDRFD
jgi:hypothetical protein